MATIFQQIINALTVGAIYALIALGYTMVYGVLRLINFAHSEMFTAGAFVAVAAAGVLGGIAGHPGIALLAGLIAFVAIGLLGVSVELVAYRPLRNSSRLAPMLSALGMAVVIQNVVMLVGGRRPLIYPSFLPRGVIQVAGAIITYKQITILVVALVLMVGLELLISRTSLGVKIRAVAESAETASLVGINPNLPIALIFFVGPGLGAVAGILYASYYGVATFSMGFIIGMKAFTAAILGGIAFTGGSGGMLGCFIGILMLNFFNTGLNSLALKAYWSTIASGALLVIALTVDFLNDRSRAKALRADTGEKGAKA